ncbi:unnamed protein product [Thlaspi arvense]|uniref:Uncharacterized protein n=1 Tax=Thlaspi arvense TaxID=13288 RepID=A0AAU9RMK1_THLAR|nr:unnamed protein product [Thlaspi arvense]
MTTLKCLQSVVNIQSQVCGKRTQIPGGAHRDYEEKNKFQMFSDNNILKVETNGQKRWDDSLLTKEEVKAVVMSKKEASLRREKIKEYAVTHRKSAESYQKLSNAKWKYWLDEWVDTQRSAVDAASASVHGRSAAAAKAGSSDKTAARIAMHMAGDRELRLILKWNQETQPIDSLPSSSSYSGEDKDPWLRNCGDEFLQDAVPFEDEPRVNDE